MRKRIVPLLLILVFVFSFSSPAFARNALVIDHAGVLTQDQLNKLTQRAQEISDKYDIDTVIFLTDTFNGKSAGAFADDYYQAKGYAKDCSILFIAVEDRSYYLYNCGEASEAVTDYGSYYIDGEVIHFLSDNNWYGAASVYLDLNEDFYDEYYSTGEAYDVDKEVVTLKDILIRIAICLAIGAVITAFIVYNRSKVMKSVQPQTDAGAYSYDFHLDYHNDRLVDKRMSVIPLPRPQSNSGGRGPGGFSGHGGTTMHMGSHGHSYSGHGGHF